MAKKKAKFQAEQLSFIEPVISVIYSPDCNCPVEQFVIVFTFPMADKFMSRCPKCDYGCLMVLSDPIVFHVNQGKDLTLSELKEMEIPPTWQKGILEKYKKTKM